MTFETEQQMIADIKDYIIDNIPISQLTDQELEERVEQVTEQHLDGQ